MMSKKGNLLAVIELWLQENQITLAELAEEMGVSVPFLKNILVGERRLTSQRLTQIMNITNIPRATLLGVCDSRVFAGYRVSTNVGAMTMSHRHQIQQVALLLNAYESFRGSH